MGIYRISIGEARAGTAGGRQFRPAESAGPRILSAAADTVGFMTTYRGTALTGHDGGPEAELEAHRRELTGYCYRMLGSGLRGRGRGAGDHGPGLAGIDGFEGRVLAALLAVPHRHQRVPRHAAGPRSAGPGRWISGRASTADRGPSSAPLRREHPWVPPIPDARAVPADGDPAELAATAETIRLAFVAALQHLPPRQRAVLILREVLRWQATRGRRAARHHGGVGQQRPPAGPRDAGRARTRASRRREPRLDRTSRSCSARYVDAFERYDITALVVPAARGRRQSMPPYAMWISGPDEIGQLAARRRHRLPWLAPGRRPRPTAAPPSASTGSTRPAATPRGPSRSSRSQAAGSPAIHNFLDADLFPAFGLPTHLDD